MPVETSIIVALITGGMTLAGTLISNYAIHSKTIYRIEQLEKKQDKHNSLIERMYDLEKSVDVLKEKVSVANHRIDDLEATEKK